MTNITNVGPLIADKFSTSLTYDVGEYALYYGALYKCLLAVLVPGSFDESKWIQTTIADELLAAKLRFTSSN